MKDTKISVILEGCHEIKILSHFLTEQHTKGGYWLLNNIWVVSLMSALSVGLVERKMCQSSQKKIKENIKILEKGWIKIEMEESV